MDKPRKKEDEYKELQRIMSNREEGWEDAVLDMVREDFTAERMPRLMQMLMPWHERMFAQVYLLTRGKLGSEINPRYQAYLKRQWQKRLTRDNERIISSYEHGVYALGKLASRWRRKS